MSSCCSTAVLILFCNLCPSTTVGLITRKPENTETVRGFNVSLTCSTSLAPNKCVNWYHIPVGARKRNEVFHECVNIIPYFPRFKVSKDDVTGEYNLTISDVVYEDAGTYVCVDNYGAGEEAQAELTVLESFPHGSIDIGSKPLEICGNKTRAVSFSCDVGFRGRVEPKLYWQQLLRGNVLDCTNVTSSASAGRAVSNVTVVVNYSNIESVYICKSKLSQFNWTAEKLNIQYAVRVSPEETNVKAAEEEFCEVDSNVPCKNRLENEDGKIVLYSECRNSSKEIFCLLNCELTHKTVVSHMLTCTEKPDSSSRIWWIAAVLGVLYTALSVVVTILLCKYTDKCRQWRAQICNRNGQRRDTGSAWMRGAGSREGQAEEEEEVEEKEEER